MVKILTAEVAASDHELVERFALEVRMLGEMETAGATRVGPTRWIEAIEGRTLREVLASGPVEVERALDWIVQLLGVVEALHGQGIEHRGPATSSPRTR